MTFAITSRMIKGSPSGEIDADLLRLHDSHFRVNASKQLELDLDIAVSNDNLPELSAASTTVAPTQRATRQAILDLDAVGRLLPATAGNQGTVLLGDKTFGAVPASPPTISQLSFANYAFNPSDTTEASDNHQSRIIGSGYNVNDHDLIRIYIGEASILNNFVRMWTRVLWTPDDIPVERVIPSDATWSRGRNRYLVGNQVQHMGFDASSDDRPIHMTFSVAKTDAGLIRVNALHFTHWNNPSQNWFGFNAIEELRIGIAGINF